MEYLKGTVCSEELNLEGTTSFGNGSCILSQYSSEKARFGVIVTTVSAICVLLNCYTILVICQPKKIRYVNDDFRISAICESLLQDAHQRVWFVWQERISYWRRYHGSFITPLNVKPKNILEMALFLVDAGTWQHDMKRVNWFLCISVQWTTWLPTFQSYLFYHQLLGSYISGIRPMCSRVFGVVVFSLMSEVNALIEYMVSI